MEGRSEDPKKTSSAPCPNPNSPNCNFCGRNKRKISPAYGRSISFPPSSSSAPPRPSPSLFRSMSDVSPLPSPFPSLRNQIPTSPAPVPPTVKISPEKKTIPCEKAVVSSVYPSSETVPASLDPNPDSDPPAEEVMGKKLRRLGEQLVELSEELGRIAEIPKGKIETNLVGGALKENNNNNNSNTASKAPAEATEGGTSGGTSGSETQMVTEEITIKCGREETVMSVICHCGNTRDLYYKFSCPCGYCYNSTTKFSK